MSDPIASSRIPLDVNRILFVRNLPFKITNKELYDIFGKYGAIRQIRIGNTKDTRGTAYIIYEDLTDAKNACEHLSGFCVSGRYLVVLYFQPTKMTKKTELEKRQIELEQLKAQIMASKKETERQ